LRAKQFQQKCVAVLRPELRKAKEKTAPLGAALFSIPAGCGRGCRSSLRFPERLRAFLAADFDGLAAKLDADRIRAEFAIAGGACGLFHLVILRFVPIWAGS
jgi:hypothetical protein